MVKGEREREREREREGGGEETHRAQQRGKERAVRERGEGIR